MRKKKMQKIFVWVLITLLVFMLGLGPFLAYFAQ
jgi:hypothetical protein